MHVEGKVRGMESRTRWPVIRTYKGYFLLPEVTPSAKGYKPSKSSGPATRESEVEKEEVLKGYKRVVDRTSAMKTGNEVAVKEWLLKEERLIETFHEMRRLFLSTRVSDIPIVS